MDTARVAVEHDGFVPGVLQREGGVAAAVIELDALADAVRAAAEDENLPLIRRRDLVVAVVDEYMYGVRLELAATETRVLEATTPRTLRALRTSPSVILSARAICTSLNPRRFTSTNPAGPVGDAAEALEPLSETGPPSGGDTTGRSR